MSEYLPYEQFEWLKNVDSFGVMSIDKKSDVGYISEVDLEYPKGLRELHNDYPLAPGKLTVTNEILSNYCKSIVFNKNFAAIHEIKPVLIRNKPIYVGFTVLDLSK